MNISLIPLNTKGRVDFKIEPDFSNYHSDEIVRTENIVVSGSITDNGTDEYGLNLHIKGYIVVKSAINNREVRVPIDLKCDEFVHNLVENYKNSANSLDILPIVWENILLEIPIRATNPSDKYENLCGEGWEVISEEN